MSYTATHKLRDGSVEYTRDGLLHRLGGPARIGADGTKSWYESGLLHRDGGPAIERPDGTREWWLHGAKIVAAVGPAFAVSREDEAAGGLIARTKAGISPVRRFRLNMHKG